MRQARRAEAAAQSRMAEQLMETQAEMLLMLSRLQEQYSNLATGVHRIQSSVGLPSAPETPLSTKDGAVASESSEEDFTTFGL
jgi:hypothetical protein